MNQPTNQSANTHPEIISPEKTTLHLIPEDIVLRYNIFPLEVEADKLIVAHSGETDFELMHELRFITGKNIVFQVYSSEIITRSIARYYANPSKIVPAAQKNVKTQAHNFQMDPNISGNDLEIDDISVIQVVNNFISEAIKIKASDIHVEPYEHLFRVRYRIDGILQAVATLPMSKKQAVISRLKIMAELDIAEKRRPQDGRIRVTEDDRTVDIRVSTLPTDFGEKVVLRILDKTALNLDLAQLGFEAREAGLFQRTLDMPYGLILVTGPTGSGKTTTLYAALNYLNTPQRNILTVEDPIEYNLPGINQAHVRSDIGFTFAKALRAFLRQDPNVIMVGEIRDLETAEIAVRAALTGHLVLSTIHTNDAPSTISRLIDMGLEPFLISASLKLVIAQRLVRRVCPECGVRCEGESGSAGDRKFVASGDFGELTDSKGEGCAHCHQTGYKGRMALFEMMPVTEPLAEMISKGKNAAQLRAIAIEEGMQTLRENGMRKIQQCLTTPEEVLRETVG